MELRLLALRTSDTKRLADFYGVLGMKFEYHKHGNGPYHFSASIGETVFEIYPLLKNQLETDKGLRLGIAIDDFERRISTLKNLHVPFLTEPTQTDFGFMAIISDPDERKIELYKKRM